MHASAQNGAIYFINQDRMTLTFMIQAQHDMAL